MDKFIARYENALKENKTTNWKFCKKYNINESLHRHWKNGDIPSVYNLCIIAENFGISLDYLVGRSDKQ